MATNHPEKIVLRIGQRYFKPGASGADGLRHKLQTSDRLRVEIYVAGRPESALVYSVASAGLSREDVPEYVPSAYDLFDLTREEEDDPSVSTIWTVHEVELRDPMPYKQPDRGHL